MRVLMNLVCLFLVLELVKGQDDSLSFNNINLEGKWYFQIVHKELADKLFKACIEVFKRDNEEVYLYAMAEDQDKNSLTGEGTIIVPDSFNKPHRAVLSKANFKRFKYYDFEILQSDFQNYAIFKLLKSPFGYRTDLYFLTSRKHQIGTQMYINMLNIISSASGLKAGSFGRVVQL